MSVLNNLVKATVAGGIVIGSAVAYARLSDEQKATVNNSVSRARRKLADLIAPNDGVYTIPKEVEAELEALLNDDN